MTFKPGSITTVLGLFCLLIGNGAAASEQVERELTHEQELPAGGWIGLENLVGSISVLSDGAPGKVVVRARVVADAGSKALAAELADSIRIDLRETAKGTLLHVSYPVEANPAFKLPRSESKGLVAKWVPPMLHKNTVAVRYDDRLVEVGKAKGAAAVAVHLRVSLPLDVAASFKQIVGSIQCSGLRGSMDLEVVEGTILAEQIYGGLRSRTGGGEVTVLKFRGDEFDLQTGSGNIELVDVTAQRSRLHSSSGRIEGRIISAESLIVETLSGNIKLEDVEAGEFALSTDSGSVDLSSELQRTGVVSIDSASGNVTLRLGSLAPFGLQASTGNGSVKARGVALDRFEEDEGQATLGRGKGGASLRVSTVSGSVFIRPL